MYLKLAWRNALRSGRDYGVYLFTLTVLTALMAFANLTAAAGAVQAGFQTAALPALIALIMAVLLAYMGRFICRQRARELAACRYGVCESGGAVRRGQMLLRQRDR